jgi:hypothetical protein
MMVCEAAGDFQTASELLDRVLGEAGPPWLRDTLESTPEAVRTWLDDGAGKPFFDLHHLVRYCQQHEARLMHGHFDGRPGAADAQMARNVFLLARHLRKLQRQIDAVVLIRDMDGDATERRRGLEQARTEAATMASAAPLRIVLGCPDFEREAWILAGFLPKNQAECTEVAAVDHELGFDPTLQSHRLDAKRDHDAATGRPHAKSVKRVLDRLTAGDPDRQRCCWKEPALEVLRERGDGNGLAAYLDEIEEQLLPLVAGGSGPGR